jgi:hypothetical protein
MARPIKDTPVLTGKDAKIFLANIAKSETTKASAEVRAKIKADFDKLNSIAKF